MAAKKKLVPRKKPRQERSVATVDAILQATTYILTRQGWGGLNTNKIAERAGINIASLYQYFPNKEAIVAELQRRHIAKARESFPRAEEQLAAKRSLRALLATMVQASVDEHRVAPALHRVFSEELPRSARRMAPRDDQAELGWRKLCEPFFKNVPDADLALFFARVTTHAIIHEAASERPDLLDHPRFVEEIVTLLDRYLRRPLPKRAPGTQKK
ncbi:MAG: TetR/AcrR family transcriptional regulator [Polyangiaceae bacterium]|nr:TetR/AcrR family transcriptional regulator [Polyangiaceae bacterium]